MKFDTRRLRGHIITKYGTIRAFAATIGWPDSKMSRKLTGKSQFTPAEIYEVRDILGLSVAEVDAYFFTPIGSEN